jgi:hypothetical protein
MTHNEQIDKAIESFQLYGERAELLCKLNRDSVDKPDPYYDCANMLRFAIGYPMINASCWVRAHLRGLSPETIENIKSEINRLEGKVDAD